MKNITPYLPFAIIAAAAVLGVYFFYYKPKKAVTDAANAATQNAYDAELTAYDSGSKLFATSTPVTARVSATKPVNVSPAMLAKILKSIQ